MIYPSLVIVAYNRSTPLHRLLASIQQADYPVHEINLFISIDYSGGDEVFQIAKSFEWYHGPKEIIRHPYNLGLKKHILSCGDLSEKYGPVIVLEDDLVVAPGFYSYAVEALARFGEDERIAGISLYNYQYNECAKLPFSKVSDGFDNYFMQVPSSSGQLWTWKQWNGFREWLEHNSGISKDDFLPEEVILWPDRSWKKHFWKYLAETGKYFVFPSASFTTNAGESGTNHEKITLHHQSFLSGQIGNLRFADPEETINVFDSFFEMKPGKIHALQEFGNDIGVDLNASKPLHKIQKKYLISTRASNNPIKKFPIHTFPVVFNLLYPQQGVASSYLYLGETDSFQDTVESGFIDYCSQLVSGQVLFEIQQKERAKTTKSDEYVIGIRILKMVVKLPSFLKNPLLKFRLFRNPWKKKF